MSRYHRYRFRKIDSAQLQNLLAKADANVDDFIYVTGRSLPQVNGFIHSTREDYSPTIAEVLLLELAARGLIHIDKICEIAEEYFLDTGPQPGQVETPAPTGEAQVQFTRRRT